LIKFLADETISHQTAKYLRGLGFDVECISERGLSGTDVSNIADLAEKEKRIIITFDKDFGEIYYFSPKRKLGVILLRTESQTVETANYYLNAFLKSYKNLKTLYGRLIILTEKRFRTICKEKK
jgi:predicted nuclease of predicted toxin-antitoxin system